VQAVQERERARDGAAKAAEVEAAWERKRLHNPAGGADLLILLPLRKRGADDESLELPEGSKRVRKPEMSRAMPIPLSVKCPKVGEADARAAREDADLLKRLQGSRDTTNTGKKRKATDENAAPQKK
jgi:hypothetical protein